MLRAEIERDGRITFARFMELAIYHPELGYYATRAIRAGYEGDYLTAPEMHPIFGQALAAQVAEVWEVLGEPDEFTVREYGAGRGTLAEDVLAGLQIDFPAAFRAARYELDDVNPERLAEGLERLAAAGFEDKAQRASDAAVTGLVVANELLDAFPLHRLVVRGGELQEIYTAWRDGWFADETGPLSDASLASAVEGLELAEGQKLEVSTAAREWTRSLGSLIDRGYAILIDYGYRASELYDPDRFPDGTLRAYRGHLVSDNPYEAPGQQDVTSHVDFSAISAAAGESGLVEIGFTTQAYFLAGLGIERLLVDARQGETDQEQYLAARNAVLSLIDPGGLGRFGVLVLGRGVDPARQLRGLSFSLR